MNTSGIIDAITSIVAAFEQFGIDYYIGGSVVSSIYGIPRATFDVDLIADLQAEHVHPLESADFIGLLHSLSSNCRALRDLDACNVIRFP